MFSTNAQTEPIRITNKGRYSHPGTLGSPRRTSKDRNTNQMNIHEDKITLDQLLRYAEDLKKIYREEQLRRSEYEKASADLKREMQARRAAEAALQKAHEELEERVQEHTRELCRINLRQEIEIARRISAEEKTREQLQEQVVQDTCTPEGRKSNSRIDQRLSTQQREAS